MSEDAPRQIAASDLDPSRPEVEVAETHVSSLVFIDSLVHKRKKPVRFDFVDLTTRDQREHICRRELTLNRRFSPDVYLAVEDIVDDSGHVIDHAVLMRRMPDDRRLATLVAEHDDVTDCIRSVAHRIAACHADSERSATVSATATAAALRKLWDDNLTELEASLPDVIGSDSVPPLRALARRYLDGRGVLFADRIARGMIVDGHGDLLADDIYCLADGPRILDCLEFDDRLRYGDVLADVGFLAMDLEHLGRPDLAASLLQWYGEFSGEHHPTSLAHWYIAYRASVRAKVSVLKGAGHHDDARALLSQCGDHLRAAQVHLVIVGGLPGTGKSTLAMSLGAERRWPVLRSDEIRKELAGLGSTADAAAEFGEGLYSEAMTEATYRELFARASTLIARGESVIIDASFSTARRRDDAENVARAGEAEFSALRCVAPDDVVVERLRRRAREGTDASDADERVAAEMTRQFDRWERAAEVDTSRPPSEIVDAVNQMLTAAQPVR